MSTITKFGGLLAALTITAAGTAMAGGPQWTYVDAGYLRGDSFGNNGKNDAWNVGGSFGFDLFHIQADYASHSIDDGSGGNFDYDAYGVTLGVNPHISDSTDLVLDASYGRVEPSDNSFDSVDLYSLAAGVDSMFTDKFELSAKVIWTNYNGNDTDFVNGENVGGVLAGRYHWTPSLSTAVVYTIDSEDSVGIDLRFAFGS